MLQISLTSSRRGHAAAQVVRSQEPSAGQQAQASQASPALGCQFRPIADEQREPRSSWRCFLICKNSRTPLLPDYQWAFNRLLCGALRTGRALPVAPRPGRAESVVLRTHLALFPGAWR